MSFVDHRVNTVSNSVQRVFGLGPVSQVRKNIVGTYIIEMPYFLSFWSRTKKSLSHQLMYFASFLLSVLREIHVRDSKAGQRSFHNSAGIPVSGQTTYSAQRRNFVQAFVTNYGLPVLNQIHYATISGGL